MGSHRTKEHEKLLEKIRNFPSGECKECHAVIPGHVWYRQQFYKVCQACMTKGMGPEYCCSECGLYPCDGNNNLLGGLPRKLCYRCYYSFPEWEAYVKIEYSQKMRSEGYPRYKVSETWIREKNLEEVMKAFAYPGDYQMSLPEEEREWKVVKITRVRQVFPAHTKEEIEEEYATKL